MTDIQQLVRPYTTNTEHEQYSDTGARQADTVHYENNSGDKVHFVIVKTSFE